MIKLQKKNLIFIEKNKKKNTKFYQFYFGKFTNNLFICNLRNSLFSIINILFLIKYFLIKKGIFIFMDSQKIIQLKINKFLEINRFKNKFIYFKNKFTNIK